MTHRVCNRTAAALAISLIGIVALANFATTSAFAAEKKPTPAALGAWKIRVETPTGFASPNLYFGRNGKKFKGLMRGSQGTFSLKNVKLEGNTFSFNQRAEFPMIGEITMKFSGEVDGKTMTGVVVTPQGERSFSGKRIEPKAKKQASSKK